VPEDDGTPTVPLVPAGTLVFGGRALHVIGDESWPVAAGDVFVVGGSEAHDYREIKDLRLINILFLPEKRSFGAYGIVRI
jgi:hypothetical protein